LIAPLVQQANDAEPGGPAQKKMARDRVRIREYARRLPPVSLSRVVDHIDYIVKLIGIDHVGIGSDFDGIQATPTDLSTVADLPNLTAELLRRGYTEEDVDKILGGNMLRVMEETEKQ
jgi:membrane dipeptidase